MGRNNKFLGTNTKSFFFINLLCVSDDTLVMKPWDQTGSNEKQIIPATKTIYKHFWFNSQMNLCAQGGLRRSFAHAASAHCRSKQQPESRLLWSLPSKWAQPSQHISGQISDFYATLSYTKLCAIPEQRQGEAQIRISSGNHLINTLFLNKSKERRDEPRLGGGQWCC